MQAATLEPSVDEDFVRHTRRASPSEVRAHELRDPIPLAPSRR